MARRIPMAMALLLAWGLSAQEPLTVLRHDGGPVLVCRHDSAAFKPYVAQLHTPGGIGVLRDHVADHLHHHGLMFAVTVDGTDFWTEKPTSGRQVVLRTWTDTAELGQEIAWLAPDGTALLQERRTITIHPGPCTLATWRMRLEPPAGKAEATLTGHHYSGLGMRFLATMDRAGRFIRLDQTEVAVVRGDERLAGARWYAIQGPIDGKAVTVALFDHPGNTRHPSRMFTMSTPFAYLSATLGLHQESLTVRTPLDLRYGVALWDGTCTVEQIDATYRRWVMVVEDRGMKPR
jgi:hypothetical protein